MNNQLFYETPYEKYQKIEKVKKTISMNIQFFFVRPLFTKGKNLLDQTLRALMNNSNEILLLRKKSIFNSSKTVREFTK